MKVPNKRKLQQITLNYSSDIGFKDFMKIYKKYIVEPYFPGSMIKLTTLPSNCLLRFKIFF